MLADLFCWSGKSDELVPGMTFETPITLTIQYADSTVTGLDESTLILSYWDGSEWTEDGITVVARDPDHNRLVVTIDHLPEFALFGKHCIFLPLVLRNY